MNALGVRINGIGLGQSSAILALEEGEEAKRLDVITKDVATFGHPLPTEAGRLARLAQLNLLDCSPSMLV